MTSHQVILISPPENYKARKEAGKWSRVITSSKDKKTGGLGTCKHPVTMAPTSVRTPVPSYRKVSIAPAAQDVHFLSIKPSSFELTWVDSATSNQKALTKTVSTGTTKDCILKLIGEMRCFCKVKFSNYYLGRNY